MGSDSLTILLPTSYELSLGLPEHVPMTGRHPDANFRCLTSCQAGETLASVVNKLWPSHMYGRLEDYLNSELYVKFAPF